jgi:hypothetical protein
MIVFSLLLFPVVVLSQKKTKSITPITIGSKIRLRAPTFTRGRIEGIVIEIDENSILIGVKDRFPLLFPLKQRTLRPIRVSRQEISQLDISIGKRRQPLEGMLTGAAAGLFSFAFIVAEYHRDGFCITWESASFLGNLMLGGAIWGVIIGSLTKRDRWISVPLENARFSLAPIQQGGVRLSLSVRF